MILMAILPGLGEGASHAGGYPATKDLWATVDIALRPHVGQPYAQGRYRLSWITEDALGLVRIDTGSTVRVTRSKTEKTYERLLAGEEIAHRKIDYTVAIEFGVLLALGNLVEDTGSAYKLARRS